MPKYWREEQLSDNSRAFLVASQNRPANNQVETVKSSCFFSFHQILSGLFSGLIMPDWDSWNGRTDCTAEVNEELRFDKFISSDK